MAVSGAALANPLGPFLDFAQSSGIGWWEAVGGVSLLVVVARIPGILTGIADIIRARQGEERQIAKRREQLREADEKARRLENATRNPKTSGQQRSV